MDKYMKMGIKAVIEAFPGVGKILKLRGIGCVACTVGTCELADVVKLHALPPPDEAEMMFQIEQIISTLTKNENRR